MRLLIGSLLFIGLMPLRAPAADTVTPEQRQAFERIIHDYLLQHPEVVIQSLQAAEDKGKQQSEARARSALVERHADLVNDPTAPVGGNPNGDVTIVEFFDYRCPYCKQVEPSLEALLREDGKVRIVYKEFPILGKEPVYSSRVALAAHKQDKYKAFHTAMMAAKVKIDEDAILRVATSVGINIEKVKTDMGSAEIDEMIKRNYELAEALDIRGTPAFVIGRELIPGAIDITTMKEKIAAARKAE